MTDPEPNARPVNTFVRGTETGADNDPPFSTLAFHDFCAISPRETFYREEEATREFRIIPRGMRPLLRYWPVTMLCLTLVYLSIPLFEPHVDPVWAYFPGVGLVHLAWVVGAGLLWLALFRILVATNVVERHTELFKPALVYGLAGVLLAVVGFSVVLVVTSDDPSSLPANVVFGSGFLFSAYVSGMFAYDLLMRTEFMLQEFGGKNIVPNNVDGYENGFLARLEARMSKRWRKIPLPYLFGVLFTLQLAVFWFVQDGPQHLNSTIAIACNVFFDTILMAAVLQFLVLIKHINVLLNDEFEHEGKPVVLEMQPFHPDNHGGFRDLGRAAMQVNLLIIIAGLYYTYRLFVQGSRALPSGGFDTFTNVQGLVWTIDFIGPVVIYGLVALTWLYATFWSIHLKMASDKERLILDRQASIREGSDIGWDAPIGTVTDKKGFDELLESPVWPIDDRQLQTLVLSNVVPLFLTISSLPV